MEFSLLTVIFALGLAWYFGKRSGRKEAKKRECKLHRPNYVKDKVYLCQFPISPGVKSISPYR